MNGFLNDPAGDRSSSRLAMAVTVFGVLGVWGAVCIKAAAMVDIPWGVVAFVSVVVAGKGFNSVLAERAGQ